MVETALVMPLYMLVLLGLLYFGYATLYRQRQVKAAAFAAWMPDSQSSDDLLAGFWPGAAPQDLTLTASEYPSQSDDYYGYEVPSQLTGSLAGGGMGDTFDRERIAVGLWNYALGETTQSFVWDPVLGIQEVTNTSWDSIANYLNPLAGGTGRGGGFVTADESNPPLIDGPIVRIADGLNGPNVHWLERRHATLDAEYVPPFFPAIFNELGQSPSTLRTLVDRNYPATSFRPNSTVTMDLTGRGAGWRLAAGEQSQTSDQLLRDVENAFGISLPPVD